MLLLFVEILQLFQYMKRRDINYGDTVVVFDDNDLNDADDDDGQL